MISSTIDIKTVIEYLQWIQDNIVGIQTLRDGCSESVDVTLTAGVYEFDHTLGLCDNVLSDYLDESEIKYMFLEWPECGSKIYPCDDREDFIKDVNLYCNPKRLRLIEHCIKYLQAELEKRNAQED